MKKITVYREYLKWGKSWIADDEMPYQKKPVCGVYSSNGHLLAKDARLPLTCTASVKKCPYCNTQLEYPKFAPGVKEWDTRDSLKPKKYKRHATGTGVYCPTCSWWRIDMSSVGHTESFGPSFHETATFEAIQKSFDLESKSIPIPVLRDYLMKNPDSARYTNPIRFEQLVGAIYRDIYQCDVKHVGGPGDGGIDLYAISSDSPHLIQVKRRTKKDAIECLSVSYVNLLLLS